MTPGQEAEHQAVLAHRRDYWTWVEKHAVPDLRGVLLALREHWHQINRQFYGAAMAEPYITLTTPSMPRLLGQCWHVSSWGSRLEIRLRPSLLDATHPMMRPGGSAEGRFTFVADVLAHEMIHQWVIEHLPEGTDAGYRGHGPAFTAKANEVGAAWGLPGVIVRNRAGKTRCPQSKHWPHCIRPAGYYGDIFAERVSPRRDTVRCPHCEGTGRIAAEGTA